MASVQRATLSGPAHGANQTRPPPTSPHCSAAPGGRRPRSAPAAASSPAAAPHPSAHPRSPSSHLVFLLPTRPRRARLHAAVQAGLRHTSPCKANECPSSAAARTTRFLDRPSKQSPLHDPPPKLGGRSLHAPDSSCCRATSPSPPPSTGDTSFPRLSATQR